MSTCLLIISDGREEYLRRTLESAKAMLPAFDQAVLVDDCPRDRTEAIFRSAGFPMPGVSVHGDGNHRLGFGGAIQVGWSLVKTDYVFHLEQDFVFARPVPVAAMIEVLEAHPHLAQLALLRQPWNEEERRVGGVMQQHPQDYIRRDWEGRSWMEHRRHWTSNPSVYPARICARGWPNDPHSEGHFGIGLFASDQALLVGYWGTGEEWVEHIGAVRTGTRY